MFEDEKKAIEESGDAWVEICITKPDGNKFRMLLTADEFKKMPQSKLKKIINSK